MKPPPFTYHRPSTREEVDALLEELGEEARILAGGQSLIPLLNFRLARPAHLVDVNRLEGEASLPRREGDRLRFGPLVRQQAALESPEVAEASPLVAEALRYVAHPAIRSRGTVVGSIAHADPAAELPAVLVLGGGEVAVRGTGGRRTVPADRLFLGPFETALKPGEWVEEVAFASPPEGVGTAFEEFARRSGDFAVCGVAARARRRDGRVEGAVAYLGMEAAPETLQLPPLGEEDLAGEGLAEALAALVDEHLDPPEDVHATSTYRRRLAVRLGARAVRRAAGEDAA